MYKLLILLVLLCPVYLAQALFETFEPLIPHSCINNEDKKSKVASKLDDLAEYNPSLIYDYLEYLKILEEDPVKAKTTLHYLDYETNIFNEKLSGWIDNELNLVETDAVSEGVWFRLWTYFYFFKKSVTEIEELKRNFILNDNYRDYITYLVYKKEYEDYNESTDYRKLLNVRLRTITKDFTDIYNSQSGTYSNEYINNTINTASENPLLFKGTVLPYVEEPAPFNYTDFFLKASSLMTNTLSISIGPGLDFTTNHGKPVYSDDAYTIKFNPDVRLKNSLQVNMDWDINIQNLSIFLSNLKVGISVGYSDWTTSDYSSDFNKPYRIIYYNGAGTRVDPNFTLGSINYSSINYQLKLTTQILYISRLFNFEGGALFSYNDYTYTADLKRWDTFYLNRQHLSDNLLVRFDKRTDLESEDKFNIYPLIFLNCNIWKPLTLRLSVVKLNSVPEVHLLYNLGLIN